MENGPRLEQAQGGFGTSINVSASLSDKWFSRHQGQTFRQVPVKKLRNAIKTANVYKLSNYSLGRRKFGFLTYYSVLGWLFGIIQI